MQEPLESHTTPLWDYPWQEWQEAGIALGGSTDAAQEQAWFVQRYPHEPEARWKWLRFAKSRSYLWMHRGRFGEFEVRGLPGGARGVMIAPALLQALWRADLDVASAAQALG